jgi:hypothetical protein
MFKSQRAAYLVLLVGLDILALFLAFVAAWALRDSLGNLLVWAGQTVSYPVKEMVRNTAETSPFYRILLSPNPLVGFNNHLFIFYLAIPGWLFFLNAQRGYDPQAQRNGRQEFALCAYAGMLGTAAFLVMLYLIKFQVSRLLILNLMLMGVAFLWISRTVLLPLLLRRGRQPIRHLVVIGSREATANFAKVLQTPAYRASRLVGFVSDEEDTATTGAASTQKGRQHRTHEPGPSGGSRHGSRPPGGGRSGIGAFDFRCCDVAAKVGQHSGVVLAARSHRQSSGRHGAARGCQSRGNHGGHDAHASSAQYTAKPGGTGA